MFEVSDFGAPVNWDAGEWVGGFDRHPNTRLKVRGFGYPPFRDEMFRLERQFPQSDDPGFVAGASQALVDHILVDWENLVAEKGRSLKYSKERAQKYLTAEDERGQSARMRMLIIEAARKVQSKIDGIIEDVEGN